MGRTYDLKYSLKDRAIYADDNTAISLERFPYILYGEQIDINLQLVEDAVDFTPYAGLVGETVACTAAVDNDWVHYYSAVLDAAPSAGLTGAITEVTVASLSTEPVSSGTITLIDSSNNSESISYTSVTDNGSGGYTFTVDATLSNTYVDDDTVRVKESLLIKTSNDNIDQTDKDTGLFVITLDGSTEPFQQAAQNTDQITGCLFEMQIRDAATDLILVLQFQFLLFNILDDEGALPPPVDNDYYTEAEVNALLSGYVLKSAFNANTILAANADNTPAALTVAEGRIVGRASGGNIDDLTPAQVAAILASTSLRGTGFDFTVQSPDTGYDKGLLFYSAATDSLAFYNNDASLKLNIGEEVWAPLVLNDTGGAISNGEVVYISSADLSSGYPTIAKAKADTWSTSRIVGVATEDIANGATGRITVVGLVNNIDTSTFSTGAIVYLSSTTAGGLSSSRATGGNYNIPIGRVIVSDATTGSLYVKPVITELTVEESITNGWPDSASTDVTYSFNDSSNTFTIAPTGSSFYYYSAGMKQIKTSPDSVAITDSSGLHAIYYDGATLTALANPTDAQITNLIISECLVAWVYWNSTTGAHYYLGQEWHKFANHYSGALHNYLHFEEGARYANGIVPGDFVIGDGSLDSHAQFSITAGAIRDEDLYTTTPAFTSTEGNNIWYRSGVGGAWVHTTNTGFRGLTTGTGRLAYNSESGGTWALTEVTDNDYVLWHIFANNEYTSANRIMTVLGQNEYASLTDAQTGATTEATSLLTGDMPFAEFRLIATVILNTRDLYANAVKAKIVLTEEGGNYLDWTTASVTSITGSAGDHNSLSGLLGDSPYYHISLAAYTDVQTLLTSNQGDIFYDNGSALTRLTPGTSGQYLQTQGPAANPLWAPPAGGGDVLGPATNEDGTVPVWNGSDSKTLADSGLTPQEISYFWGNIL
jgi:hypothetical protein